MRALLRRAGSLLTLSILLMTGSALLATDDLTEEALLARLPEFAKYSQALIECVEPEEKEESGLTVRVKIAPDGYEPFTFGVGNIIKQTRRRSSHNGVNIAERQISATAGNDLVQPPIEFLFYPTEWKVPEPPDGFDELLKMIARR